ncbi:MAG: PEP-CTERM sorting domain-containing protein [Puniceicoccaceae bacterium]|nr:MAG: PEP-CTERM sorting domain-containing protein [Puniceicoccaceae bacterium]
MHYLSQILRCTAGILLPAVFFPFTAFPAVIAEADGLFTPSFRGESHTGWFGWSPGTFFGDPVPPAEERRLDRPAPNLGTLGPTDGVTWFQNDAGADSFVLIGASSGNIYTGQGRIGRQAFATLELPATGAEADGFTTLIIQGRTTTSGFGGPEALIQNFPVFGSVNGADPTFVIGANSVGQGQWWAKYELPGNPALITVPVEFPGGPDTFPISLAALAVDVGWSPSGYFPDTVAAVPEPATSSALFGLGVLLAILFFRRTTPPSQP